MNKDVNLYTISIDDFLLINKNINDPVYKFCLKHNIITIGELISKFDNDELNIIRVKSYYQVRGFIDLIKYYYLNEDNIKNDIFFVLIEPVFSDEFKYIKYVISTKIKNSNYKYTLERLGFSSDEIDAIRGVVREIGKEMTVIECLINYKKNPKNKLRLGKEKAAEIFNKKIDILIDYYKNYREKFCDKDLVKRIKYIK